MKIWIIHQHAIPRNIMGPTRHFDLAKKLIEQGHEVFIFAGNYSHNDFNYIAPSYNKTKKIIYYDQVPFIWLQVPAYKKNSIARLWNMICFAMKLLLQRQLELLPKPDVILGSSPSPFAAFAAKRLALRFKVPFIYEIRDLWPATLLNLGRFSKYHPLVLVMQYIENNLLKNSLRVLTTLPGIKDYLQKKGIATNKLHWLPNGVNLEQIPYIPVKAKRDIAVYYAGSFNVANDVETLLQAAKILLITKQHRIAIKLIGEGPLHVNLQELVKVEGLSNVEFLPRVSKDKIYQFLNDADIFVGMVKQSPLYQFGTSLNKMSDYLALGRPIIFAIDSPYNPISEANAGLTVLPQKPEQLAEAIIKIASLTHAERLQMGKNARCYAELKFDMERLATDLIKQLL